MNPYSYKPSARVNIGLELSRAHFYQLTTNFYYSFVDALSFRSGRSTFQDKSGFSARITCNLLKKITPFFSIAYTNGLQKEYRFSTEMNKGTLITAAIGVHHRISDYTNFEWKINIPELLKCFSEDAIITNTYYQKPIHFGIQFKFNETNDSINKLPERCMPYHAHAASKSMFRV